MGPTPAVPCPASLTSPHPLSHGAPWTRSARRRAPVWVIDDAAAVPPQTLLLGDLLFLLAFYYIMKGDKESIKKASVL